MDDPASKTFGKEDFGILPNVVEAPEESQHWSCCSQYAHKSDVGTKTDEITNESKGKSHLKIVRVTRKYQKRWRDH